MNPLATSSDSIIPVFTESDSGHLSFSMDDCSSFSCEFDCGPSSPSKPMKAEPEWIHGTASKETEGDRTFYVHRIISEGGERNVEQFRRLHEVCRGVLNGDVSVSVSEHEGKTEIVVKRPYFPGQSVKDMVSKMSVKDKLLCLYDVSVQLSELHEKLGAEGVAHGGVMLSNIFKDESSNRYFITDEFLYLFEPQYCMDVPCAWDQCLLKSNNTRRDCLSLQYLSPSVLQSGIRAIASDVFGFGILAYHIFNKALPFAFKMNKEDLLSRLSDSTNIRERLRIPGAKMCFRELESRMKTLLRFCFDESNLNAGSMREVRNFLHKQVFRFLIPEDEPRIFWFERISPSLTLIRTEIPMDELIKTVRLSWEPFDVDPGALGYDEYERKLRVLLEYGSSYDSQTASVTMEKFNRLFCWFGKFFINRDDFPPEGESDIREEFLKHVHANIDQCFDLIYVKSDVLTSPKVKDHFLGHLDTNRMDMLVSHTPKGTFAIGFNPSEYYGVKNFPFIIKYSAVSSAPPQNSLSCSFGGGHSVLSGPLDTFDDDDSGDDDDDDSDDDSSGGSVQTEVRTAYLARFNTGFITERTFFTVTMGLSNESGDGAIGMVSDSFKHPYSKL